MRSIISRFIRLEGSFDPPSSLGPEENRSGSRRLRDYDRRELQRMGTLPDGSEFNVAGFRLVHEP